MIRACMIAMLVAGCTHPQPKQPAQPVPPEMRVSLDPFADILRESIYETAEGGTFPSAGTGATTGWIKN